MADLDPSTYPMSLNPTSYCGRIVRRHVFTPCDHIWISDSALTSAFERYCSISRTSVRHGSSVPGPMENRRRLGKRHMGELAFGQSQAGVPFWELANTVDLTQWRWHPPTLQDTHRQGSQVPNTKRRALDEMLSDWLLKPDPDPEPDPDPDLVESTRNTQDVCTENVMPQEVLVTTWDAHTNPQDIVDQGLKCLFQDVSLSTTSNFSHFCSDLSQSLSNRWFSDESICFISRHVREGLASALGRLSDNQKEGHMDDLSIQLFEAILNGLAVRVSNECIPFDRCAWDDLLHGISKLRRNSLRTFNKAMLHIPPSSLNAVSSGILANLDAYFTAMGKEVNNGTVNRQANKLANAFQKLGADLNPNTNILVAATKKVSDYVTSRQLGYEQIRLSWLHVLARMPSISQEYLAQTCVILEADRTATPLTRLDLGRLFLAQCHRRKVSNFVNVQLLYHSMNRTDPDNRECYTNLCTTFWKTDQYRHIRDLCQFLKYVGRSQDLLQLSRGFNTLVKNHATPLANLALGIGDPQLAIRILTSYADVRHQGGEFWESDVAEQAMKEILANRIMNPRKLFSALGMFRKRRGRVELSRRANTPAILTRQVWKVARLARVLAKEERISNRTRLKLITLCVHYLRYHNARLPLPLIQALIHNVTRDLADGGFGRTTRINWPLRLAHKYTSPKMAYKLVLAVERWRRQNSVPQP